MKKNVKEHDSRIYSNGQHDFPKMTPIETIRDLLENKNVDPNSHKDGYTAFHCALNYGEQSQELLALLFAHDANPNVKNRRTTYLNSPLHHYIAHECTILAAQFIDTAIEFNRKIDFNITDSENKTSLILAAKLRQGAIAFYILEKATEINVNLQDIHGMTALHYACALGQLVLAKELLNKGADFNIKNKEGNTPLDCTALSEEAIKYIFKSVDIDPERDENALTNHIRDLYLAELAPINILNLLKHKPIPSKKENQQLVETILREGAWDAAAYRKTGKPTKLSDTSFFRQLIIRFTGVSITAASIRDRKEVKDYLISQGANYSRLIREAAQRGDEPGLMNLLKNTDSWIYINQPGLPSKKTALHRAAMNGHTQICALLIKAGAELDSQDSDNNTPSNLACINYHTETVVLLTESGADIAKTNKEDKAVFDLVFESTKDEPTKKLKNKLEDSLLGAIFTLFKKEEEESDNLLDTILSQNFST